MISRGAVGNGLLALFVLSGFAGLIYQSVWSHYLGLTLGHAAYAQSLVLAIYMGGMALGAWLASRYGVRWKQLIVAYAIVEGAIGVMGLLFHPVFLSYTAFSQDTVLPGISSDWLATAWQWSSAALLIAPQSVLLGMTFPLMTGGYLRMAPSEDGRILGGLYFTNSIGAAAGALTCTFVLLPAIGMPGTARLAGCINLLVAVLSAILAMAIPVADAPAAVVQAPSTPADDSKDHFQRWMLAAAFVTGATSFVYEVGWVRLLNQALGTTVHSFELMLSSFIAGLAFGGLWIRHRSARLHDPVAAAGNAQVFMGVAALLSIPMFTQSFRWVGWMMSALARNESGYVLFDLGSATIAMLVMFPAAFFAGMTLPLMTMSLLRRGHGEASIGRIYAANTLGAIVGVFVTMHVLVPAIGVALSVTLAAFGDLLLGLVLLRYLAASTQRRGWVFAGACGVVATLVSLHYGRVDPGAQVAGVFRTGVSSIPVHQVKFLRDGKTATVGVFTQANGIAIIATNGKPDAGIEVEPGRPVSFDESTMRMAAALPLAIHPHPRDVAIIGWGSGLSTATYLASPVPASVDTIEIERAMYDGARLFGPIVARDYTDPRSHPRFDDARTWFSTGNRQFDIIASEPSNPWVSGVASLFTEEFYGLVRKHLRPDGIMLQWIQSYELNDRLLGTMVAALIKEFPHTDVYLTNTGDLMFVASMKPLPAFAFDRLQTEPLRTELGSIGLQLPGDYAVRRIGSERVLRTFVRAAGSTPHSDFYPVVSLEAPRARFMGEMSSLLQLLVLNGMPVLDVLEHRIPPAADAVTDVIQSEFVKSHFIARDVASALRTGNLGPLQARDPDTADHARTLLAMRGKVAADDMPTWYSEVSFLAGKSIGSLPAGDLRGVWIEPAWIDQAVPLPAPAGAVLAAFDAAARRDVAHFYATGVAALVQLRHETAAPDALREQMLLIAMLGAINDGRPAQVAVLEQTWGSTIPPSNLYGPIRAFLEAWADPGPTKSL